MDGLVAGMILAMEAVLGAEKAPDAQILRSVDFEVETGVAVKRLWVAPATEVAATPAAKSGRVFELDPTLLVGGLGPRLPSSLVQLSAGFYPSQAKPAP